MNEITQIQVEFLTELLNIRREHNKICEEFKIPLERRGEKWVGIAIIERIHTYLSGYVARRSIAERENGAAFVDELKPLISDPEVK